MLTSKEAEKLDSLMIAYVAGNNDKFKKGVRKLSRLEVAQLITCQSELRTGIYIDRAQVLQFEDYLLRTL